MPKPTVLDAVKAKTPEVIGPEHVASVAVGEDVTYSHHVLVGHAFACGNNVCRYYPCRLLKMSSYHAEQIFAERKTLVNSSAQEHATGSSSDSPLWEVQIGKKSTAEASTQTYEDMIVDDISNDSLASPSTLVNTPTERASAMGSEDNERQEDVACESDLFEEQNEEEQMQEENTGETCVTLLEEETVEDLHDRGVAGSTAAGDEALSIEMAAHQQTREELAQLQGQIATKDTQIQIANDKYLRLFNRSVDSYQELEQERDDLLEQLEEANSRISELEQSNGDEARKLQSHVEYLTNAVQRMWGKLSDQHNFIRVGCKTLNFYIRLGTKLHARLDRVDRILKGSPSSIRAELGSADRLMRFAEKWFPIAVPAKKHSKVIQVQLAIESPPAHFFESLSTQTVAGHEEEMADTDTEQPISDIRNVQEGEAGNNGRVTDVKAERPSLKASILSNVRDAAPHTTPTNTSEGTSTESGFNFSTGSPYQETENRVKKPMFKFGGTPVQDPRPKAKCKAKEPVALFAATPAQETLQDIPSRVTASAQILTSLQQTAPPDVQAANHNSKARTEWVDGEEPTEGPTKKSRTTSIREAANSVVDSTSSSSDTKEENANKKTKKASIYDTAASINLSSPSSGTEAKVTVFDAAAAVNLSPLSSGSDVALGAYLENDHKRTPETPNNIYTPTFNFSETAAKGEEPAPRTASAPIFGVGTQTQFAFSPSGITPKFGGFNSNRAGASNAVSDQKPVVDGGEERQNQESTKEGSAPSPTTEENSDAVHEIEDGCEVPAEEPAKAGHVETRLTSAIDPAATNQTAAVSSEPTQVSFGTAQTQLPGLSASSGSSQPVQSSRLAPSGTQNGEDHQLSDDSRKGKNDESKLQEVTGTSSAEAPRTSSTALSTSEGKGGGKAPGVLGNLGFDVAALTRIVNSVPPAVPEKLGVVDILNSLVSRGAKSASQVQDDNAQQEISQSSGKTAAETVTRCEVEYHESTEPATASVPWRDPEWPATLPPLENPEPEWSAELSRLASSLTTATASTRTPTPSQVAMSSLEAIEEGLRYVMAGIESLHIGPAAPPVIDADFDPDKHFLSGDWVSRRYREVVYGDEKSVEQRRAGRAVVRGHESQVLSQSEIGKEEAPQAPFGEAQEAMASREQERSAEPKAVVESEPKETDSALASDERVGTQPRMVPQMKPHMGLQMEATATSETQAAGAITATSCESQEQKKDTMPKKPSGGLRIWSLKKKR